MSAGEVVFAWRPVPLAEYRHPHWHMTGEYAWLCKVERIVKRAGMYLYGGRG